MIYPEGDALKERVRNRYSLVVLAAKRAKQIKEGAPVLIDTSSTNTLTIALEEIAAGKVSYAEHVEAPEDDESPAAIAAGSFSSEDAAGSDFGLSGLLDVSQTEGDSEPSTLEEASRSMDEPLEAASQAEPSFAMESAPEVEEERGDQLEPVEER